MATEIKLPELGEGIAGGDVLNVLVKAGDMIEFEQTLLEIETDKAVVEIEAPATGTITQLVTEPGTIVKMGGTIGAVQ